MVSFKDGSSSASDADIIRTQIESLLEIMLVQVKKKNLFHRLLYILKIAIFMSFMLLTNDSHIFSSFFVFGPQT